jgi:hypothetical protein
MRGDVFGFNLSESLLSVNFALFPSCFLQSFHFQLLEDSPSKIVGRKNDRAIAANLFGNLGINKFTMLTSF